MSVPFVRPRRLRDNSLLREVVAETSIQRQHLMLPVFVADEGVDEEIQGMPGVVRYSIDGLCRRMEALVEKGLRSFIVFGVPTAKDPLGAAAAADDGIVPRALRAVRTRLGNAALVATDVCLCSYTTHGHCGLIEHERVANDVSLDPLANAALCYAQAGADIVAPSDMMDGRVRRIREVLDAAAFAHVPIMSYAVKYASSLYGPFRHAADSAPQFGDRRGYQMDVRNRREALREALLDADEGADILMVKPGVAYLDILRDLREATTLPLAAYQVSGEYAMVRYAAQAGAIDEAAVVRELYLAMRRAGADLILSYHAAEAVLSNYLDD